MLGPGQDLLSFVPFVCCSRICPTINPQTWRVRVAGGFGWLGSPGRASGTQRGFPLWGCSSGGRGRGGGWHMLSFLPGWESWSWRCRIGGERVQALPWEPGLGKRSVPGGRGWCLSGSVIVSPAVAQCLVWDGRSVMTCGQNEHV